MTASQLMGLAEKYARAYHKWHGEDMEEGDHKRLEEARAALYDALVAAGVAIPFAACGECRTADLCAEGGCAVKNCPPSATCSARPTSCQVRPKTARFSSASTAGSV